MQLSSLNRTFENASLRYSRSDFLKYIWEIARLIVPLYVEKKRRNMSKQPHFPACFVELPLETEGRRAAFYLAAEEYIAERLPEGSYFFTWQTGPTVVMGRNQVAHQEVDLDFCRREGIDVIRRRSGGGAIFADERNIMTSLVTEDGPVEELFREYAEAVAQALRRLGAPAFVSGRNDIVLSSLHSPLPSLPRGNASKALALGSAATVGKAGVESATLHQGKVCGNAFYHKTHRCIAHGTMLYDTNPRLMEGALHPDVSKLEQKGVKSVRSRVSLLKDYLPFGVGELRQQLRQLLTDRTVCLTSEDVCHIEHLEQRYYEPAYFYGSSAHSDAIRSRRIEGCGLLELCFSLQGSLITDVQLRGDFFDLGQAQERFSQTFVGRAFPPESMGQAVRDQHPERNIRGLSEESLTLLLHGD